MKRLASERPHQPVAPTKSGHGREPLPVPSCSVVVPTLAAHAATAGLLPDCRNNSSIPLLLNPQSLRSNLTLVRSAASADFNPAHVASISQFKRQQGVFRSSGAEQRHLLCRVFEISPRSKRCG
jgi:hypothetical protein